MTDASLFPFVQLELPGALGLADGRYLIRSEDGGEPEAVLVLETIGAAPAGRRPRRRPRAAPPRPDAEPLPLTRATVVRAREPCSPAEAEAWLDSLRRDHEALDDFVAAALAALNRALHVHGVAAMDPYPGEVALEAAMAVRTGYGAGEEVADGEWSDALEVERREPKRRRADALRPQERVAAVLGGRERIDACETLLLRARRDLDAGRIREAALQLRAGLETLLVELPDRAGPDQEEDMARLADRRQTTAAAADEAARGALGEGRAAEVERTLAMCERVLRRRRILGA